MPQLCPCGSALPYSDCCELIHQNPQSTPSAEKLMRSRFSAFALSKIDFIIATYHSSCHAQRSESEISYATDIEWLKLEIIAANSESNTDDISEDYVEFKAWFKQDNQLQLHHEKSRFVKEQIEEQWCWRYIDGLNLNEQSIKHKGTSSKIKRNDPCPCNSGKKYKKCCM